MMNNSRYVPEFKEKTGSKTSYTQNGADKLTFTYFSRDEEDRITGIIENDNGITKATVYEYDSFGRLMRVKNDGEIKTTYYYDTNGNRTHRCTPETGCIELHYNAQDQLTKYGTNTYTYTLNGELKTKGNPEGVTVYDHDPMGNLVQVILPNSTVIGYTYDAKNRRVAKMVNGFITERLIYKDQLAPIAKLDGDGNVLEEYVYGTGVNSPDYIRKDGVNYRVIKDLLGSVRMIDNASTGEIVKEIEYDEFGNITAETGAYSIPFGFAGGLQDRDTGLIHFGARWYDPEVGRWISKEPLGFEGAMNFYSYCDGDPVNKIDVTGLKPGDYFFTETAAAVDAIDWIRETGKNNYEWGGIIIKVDLKKSSNNLLYIPEYSGVDTLYYATDPIKDPITGGSKDTITIGPELRKWRQIIDIFSEATAVYHTHVYPTDIYLTVQGRDGFTNYGDIDFAKYHNVNIYLGRPLSFVKKGRGNYGVFYWETALEEYFDY
jgi:RHS repeat-associated protein